jgi:hypothetical protein
MGDALDLQYEPLPYLKNLIILLKTTIFEKFPYTLKIGSLSFAVPVAAASQIVTVPGSRPHTTKIGRGHTGYQ